MSVSWKQVEQYEAESVAGQRIPAYLDIPQTLCKHSEVSSSNPWGTSIVCSACSYNFLYKGEKDIIIFFSYSI